MAYPVSKLSNRKGRAEQRFPYRDLVNVTTIDDDGVPLYRENIQCLEVSQHGVRIALSNPVETGNRIIITATKPGLKAQNAVFEVAWCAQESNQYHLGAKLISSPGEWMVRV